jgi:hypothetical protein
MTAATGSAEPTTIVVPDGASGSLLGGGARPRRPGCWRTGTAAGSTDSRSAGSPFRWPAPRSRSSLDRSDWSRGDDDVGSQTQRGPR